MEKEYLKLLIHKLPNFDSVAFSNKRIKWFDLFSQLLKEGRALSSIDEKVWEDYSEGGLLE